MDTSPLVPDSVKAALTSLTKRLASDADAIPRELEAVPVHQIDALLDECDGWIEPERLGLLEVLTLDPREYVRGEVATRAAAFGEPLAPAAERILACLACDSARAVRQGAAASLGVVMQRIEGFTRTRLLGAWALSNFRGQRLAISQALRWPFPVVGAVSAIELLSADDDAEVRIAAAEAAKIRLRDSPSICNAILRRLTNDPDPGVRRAVGIDTEQTEIRQAPL
jgi:hypothetical protein